MIATISGAEATRRLDLVLSAPSLPKAQVRAWQSTQVAKAIDERLSIADRLRPLVRWTTQTSDGLRTFSGLTLGLRQILLLDVSQFGVVAQLPVPIGSMSPSVVGLMGLMLGHGESRGVPTCRARLTPITEHLVDLWETIVGPIALSAFEWSHVPTEDGSDWMPLDTSMERWRRLHRT